MRDYELTLVINPDLTSEEQKKLITEVKKIITGLKGKVEKTDEWGKKKLTYPIKKKTSGYYFFLEIKLPEKILVKVDKKLRLEEKIIRYLLVRHEEPRKSIRGKRGKGGNHGAKVA